MSAINPNHSPNPYTAKSAKDRNKQGKHLGLGGRTKKIVFSPVVGSWQGLKSGAKASSAAAATVGGLVATKHPVLATFAGLGSLVAVPMYAVGKALGRFVGNLKAGVTGYAPTKR